MGKVNRDIERLELCVFGGREIYSSILRKDEIDCCLNCTKDECDNCISYMEGESGGKVAAIKRKNKILEKGKTKGKVILQYNGERYTIRQLAAECGIGTSAMKRCLYSYETVAEAVERGKEIGKKDIYRRKAKLG